MLTTSLRLVDDTINRRFEEGVDYVDLGGQVKWVRRADGILVKRFIAGTSKLSQHVGGNAKDYGVGPAGPSAIDAIDAYVRTSGLPVGRILWRGVRGHDGHHAHIEGWPELTQEQLWSFYDNEDETEEEEMREFVEFIQGILVELGYDLGKYGPNEDGIDGDPGPKTRAALMAALSGAEIDLSQIDLSKYALAQHTHPTPKHDHKVTVDSVTGGVV